MTGMASHRSTDISFVIFSHSDEKLKRAAAGVLDDERFSTVNLDSLPLPADLRIESLPESDNRAAFAEYLGMLHHEPTGAMTGVFTYSLPLKFSFAWAHETGNYDLFLPAVSFEAIANATFAPNTLYAAELGDPMHRFSEEMGVIIERFGIGEKRIQGRGPFKGSFVCDSGLFRDYRDWLFGVAAFAAHHWPPAHWANRTSPFAASSTANKNAEELRLDPLRHGIGGLLERATAYYFAQTVPKKHRVRLPDHLNHTPGTPSLSEALSHLDTDRPIIVVFANSAYEAVLNNWLYAMVRLGIDNILVVALDPELQATLGRRGIVSHLVRCSRNLDDLWVKRIRLFAELSRNGIDFIHSDADAVWLENPIPAYFTDMNADIVITQGTYWPRDVHEQWGFVLCCGLFAVVASDRTADLLSRMADDVRRTKDDQVSFNRMLREDNITWTINEPRSLAWNGMQFTSSRSVIEGSGESLTVQVLPHHLFQRVHEPNEPAMVKHVLSEKTGERTRAMLESCGCWFHARQTDAPRPARNGLFKRLAKKLLHLTSWPHTQ